MAQHARRDHGADVYMPAPELIQTTVRARQMSMFGQKLVHRLSVSARAVCVCVRAFCDVRENFLAFLELQPALNHFCAGLGSQWWVDPASMERSEQSQC